MPIFGYSRVSTNDQTSNLQTDALEGVGCIKIFSDTMSGATTQRPGLEACLEHLRPGDTLAVWRIDRVGRSLTHLLEILDTLHHQEIEFISLSEGIDTRTPAGRMVYSIMGALAEYERCLIRERVKSGLDAARRRGRIGGRKPVVTTSKAEAIKALKAQDIPIKEICASLGISERSYFRHQRELRLKEGRLENVAT